MKIRSVKIIEFGQSLFEVLVALALVGLIITAVVSLATASIRNSDFSRDNSLATKYAQEGAEWVRQQRDESWLTVRDQVSGSNRNLGILSWSSPSATIPDTNFTRIVKLTWNNVQQTSFESDVIVSWVDGQGTHEVRSRTILTNWQGLQ